jgi:hypothetical protein
MFHGSETGQTETPRVLGRLTRTTHGREPWVGDGWLGFLMADAKLIAGRWHQRGDLWEFAPDNPDDLATIRTRPDWNVLDGYWGERAELVLDRTRRWDKDRVQPTDAIRVQGPTGVWLRPLTDTDEGLPRRARAFPGEAGPAGGDTRGGEVVRAGWDHEHCAICWETLGPGGQPEGYVSSQRIWVCERCYINFVERRSLDFIQSV